MSDSIKASSRSWFCVWNNPQTILDGTPEEIAEKALEMWVSLKPTRTGAVAYCVSADGLKHLHMVLEDAGTCRFSAIKKAYPQAHIEPTRGNKEQAENYIKKKGQWEEKGEEVIYTARHGEIKGAQGQRKDLEIFEDLIKEGYTPDQILDMSLSYRRYEKMIRDAHLRKREKETPFLREVKVYYHIGRAGSGKSYTAMKLLQEHGEENIYFMADYETGGLDGYQGQKILFMDEFRGQIRFNEFLKMLQGYKMQFHARYKNVTGLWEEVHITSVLPIENLYQRMVNDDRNYDTIEQLKRRITTVVYHYVDEVGEFKTKEIPMAEYNSFDELEHPEKYQFKPITYEELYAGEQLKIPFEEK